MAGCTETWFRYRYSASWQQAAAKVRREIGTRNIPLHMFYRVAPHDVATSESAGPIRVDVQRMLGDSNLDGALIFEADDSYSNDPQDPNSVFQALKEEFARR